MQMPSSHRPHAEELPLVGSYHQVKPSTTDTPASGYRDKPFAVLFYIHLAGMIFFAVYTNQSSEATEPATDEDDCNIQDEIRDHGGNIAGLAGIGFIAAVVLSWLWLVVMQRYAKGLITFTLWFSVACLGLMTLLSIATGNLAGFLTFAISTTFSAMYAYFVRSRIPFASAMLVKCSGLIRKYTALVLTAFGGVFFEAASLVLIGACLNGMSISGLSNNYLVLFVFSMYWTQQVVSNTVHVTVAGTVGSDYFHRTNMPENPTLGSLKRALTTSFGSICFGSLLVAILQTLRWLVESLRSHLRSERNDNLAADLMLCCLECVLNVLESVLKYFNKYAFVQVGVYGKTFIESAKDTLELLEASGISALINDDLVSGVLSFAILVSAVLDGLFVGLLSYYVVEKDDAEFAVALGLIAFLVAILVVSIVMSTITSAVATIFVCFAQDPDTLPLTDPEFFSQLVGRQAELGGASTSSFGHV
eukprot:Rmarinus@m.21229